MQLIAAPFDDPRANLAIRLKDGRRLGYADVAREAPVPAFYFHGFPGSRLESVFFRIPGLRLIGVDRPGYGLSDRKLGRRLIDWPADVAELADFLGFDEFAVIGVSGGAPYACAVASKLSHRVRSLSLICGLGPPEAPGMEVGRMRALSDLGARRYMRFGVAALGRRVVLSDWAMGRLHVARSRMRRSTTDMELMNSTFSQLMTVNWREGLSRSSTGMATDARIYQEPWPFDLADIDVPTVIWHGEADTIVPVSIGRYYAAHVPGSEAHFPAEDGHLSIIVNRLDDVARFVLHGAAARATTPAEAP